MFKRLIPAVGLALLFSAGATLAASGKKPKPAGKPAAKPSAKLPTKGTVQMAGDNGRMGTTYTIGKGNGAINFTLLSAEYSITRMALTGETFVPQAEEKWVVLHYTAHNPNPRPYLVFWGSLKYTGVDSEDINREGSDVVVKEGTPERLRIDLKPAQKVAGYTWIKLPAKATLAKLIVQHANDQPVLRYFFDKDHPENVIKPLAAPFADPADAAGAAALPEVPAQKDTAYPFGLLEVKLTGVATSTEPFGTRKPRAKERFVLVTLSAKNTALQKRMLYWGTIEAVLKTADGDKIKPEGLFKATSDDAYRADLDGGEEATARLLFKVPAAAELSKLTLREGSKGRAYVFEGDALK